MNNEIRDDISLPKKVPGTFTILCILVVLDLIVCSIFRHRNGNEI